MYDQIVKILKRYTDRDPQDITPDSRLQSDLELNSLDVVNIVIEFEDTFNISISDDEITKFFKVQDIVDCLVEKGIA